jgi:putative flippase GtrA
VQYARQVTDEAVAASDRVRPAGVRSLALRFEHLYRELGKFGLVGVVAYAVDTTIFNVLVAKVGLETLVSGALSMAVAATVAFVGNRFWTWRHRPRSGLRREYTLYFFFNLVGLLIALACLGITHYGLGSVWPAFQSLLADNIAKNVVGVFFGTLFRFWSYRKIVFRAEAPDDLSPTSRDPAKLSARQAQP